MLKIRRRPLLRASVLLTQSTAPCKEWVVWLMKPGCRLEIGRWPALVKQSAEARARDVASFLGIPYEEGPLA